MDEKYHDLVEKATNELQRLHYAKSSIAKYQRCWMHLNEYAATRNITEFNNDLVEYFFQNYLGNSFEHPNPPVTRKINQYHRAFSVLLQIRDYGIIYRRRFAKEHKIASCYQPAAEEYITIGCAQLAKTSIRQHRSHMEDFLDYLSVNHIADFNQITKKDILSYWDSKSSHAAKTRMYDAYFLRKFLGFLHDRGYIVVDQSVFVPRVKSTYNNQIPSYYTVSELTKLLSCVDRNNPIGKRDYAILLFAVRYGPRVEDIRDLKLGDFDWEKSVISYVQRKNNKRITLKLYDDVATAFIDYFQNGRPETECTHVFVRHNAPFTQFGDEDNLHYIISKYMRFAGFKHLHTRKSGLYILRHCIAGNLLNEGTPLPIVSEVLNHSNTETTMHYTKIAVEQMRDCALEVD